MSETEKKSTFRFVLATMFLNAIGFGLIVPVMPDLIKSLGNVPLDQATAIGGFLAFTFAAFQFLFSPIIGNLSDRFGRRPVLLGAVAGYAFDFFLLAFAPTLAWLYIARAVSGVFGATNGPAQAAIADITLPEERARYYGMFGAAFGSGFVLGPALGGLLGQFGHQVPFIAAGILCTANFLFGFFAFPETLRPENRRPFEWRRATPGGALKIARTLPNMIPISIVYLLWQVASLVYPMIWNFYCMGRYGWSSGWIAFSLSLVGLAMASAQIFVLPKVVSRLGERNTATLGIGVATIAFFGFATAVNQWIALALLPLMALQALVHPNLTAMMTRRADATTQGEIQGYASAIMAIGSLLAPLMFNPLLAWFTGPKAPVLFFGAPFVAAGICSIAALLVLWKMPRAEKQSTTSQ